MIRRVANAMPKTHKFWISFVRKPNFRALEECISLVCNGIYPSYEVSKKIKFLILTYCCFMKEILILLVI